MNDIITLEKSRLEYLDILRGFGIICIVAGHISYNAAVLNWLYSFHVSLFFFAAGAVYKMRPVVYDLKRRVMTVLVPYYFFGTAELIYWQLLERRFRPSEMSFGSSALGLLSGQYDLLDFNSHLWFLPCFFVTVVFFNALVRAGGKKAAYAAAAAMSVVYVFVPMPELPFGINRVFRYIGFYAAGVLASDLNAAKKFAKQSAAVKCSATAGLLAASVTLSCFGLTSGAMHFAAAAVGIGGMSAVSVMIGKCRPLQYLGRISLVVLCTHGAVYRILLKLLSLLMDTETDIIRRQLWAIPVTAMTLAVCAGVYEIIIRTVPVVIGGKRKMKDP